MSDVSIFETIKVKPTIIQTTRNQVIVIRALPAPGPMGPPGPTAIITALVDGGTPTSVSGQVFDGGTP